jgi:recombination protein RecT
MNDNNALAIFERQLVPLGPRFAQVLGKTMSVERLIRTIIISVERLPSLLQCDRQSLFNGAMTFAVLGLEVDGATGQGYLVPFNDRKRGMKIAQPIIGYKGYSTLGARSGMTISGGVVREGDEFDFDEGSNAFIHHKRKLGDEKKRRIIAAWATATSLARPAIVKVLSIDELLAVKAKSPRGNEPPWADPEIGFPAMCEKTAKRRLSRDMPLNVFQSAARMEEAFEEQGTVSWISPDKGVIIDGEVAPTHHHTETPTAAQLTSPQAVPLPQEPAADPAPSSSPNASEGGHLTQRPDHRRMGCDACQSRREG